MDILKAGRGTSTLLDTPASRHLTEPAISRRIGPYQVIRELGRGGMGVVYLARRADGQYEREVAIKVVRRVFEHASKRFLGERRVLARLSHPNIAHLYGAGRTPEGLPYMAMEYIDGEPIDTYCDRHQLSLEDRVELTLAIGCALTHAHERGIIHLDLKPANVLVCRGGRVEAGIPKLLDFGIARSKERGAFNPLEGRALTLAYATPEQINQAPCSVATDVYGLGVLLFKLCSGCLPFSIKGINSSALARRICEETPGEMHALFSEMSTCKQEELAFKRSTTPKGLKKMLAGPLSLVTQKALRKRQEDRYNSIGAFSEHLQQAVSRQLGYAQGGVRKDRWSRIVSQHRKALGCLALGYLMGRLSGRV